MPALKNKNLLKDIKITNELTQLFTLKYLLYKYVNDFTFDKLFVTIILVMISYTHTLLLTT